ncbi:MAG TPA: RNA methyltransferase [Bacteroidales bacterium]|nr:RNA methyltransferase [Bacteroidales bacterium]
MPVLEKISSFQNPRVKDIVKMHRSKVRREKGLMLVEGLREVLLAIDAGFETEFLMVCPALFQEEYLLPAQNLITEQTCFEVSKGIFAKMAYREKSDGILAVMRTSANKLEEIKLSTNPLLIVLESVEKPGNLGAILRTADAANADAVLVCDPLTDVFNPNVIRSSLGCVFTRQLATCTSEQALDWLRKNEIEPLATSLSGTKHHYQCNLKKPLAFILGTEADGLSNFWLSNVKLHVKIPMHGTIDSLNVSVSTAILLYEALRQREFAGNR